MARPTHGKKEDKDAGKFPGNKAASGGLIVTKKAGSKKRKSGRPKYKRNAVRAIKQLATRTKPMIPRAVYDRICREIGNDSCLSADGVRWQKSAIDVVAVAAEAHVEAIMARANMLSGLCNKETLTKNHIMAALSVMQEHNGHCTVRA